MAATFAAQAGTAGTVQGTMKLRLKPTLLGEETFSISNNGQSVTMHEIVSAKAFYINGPLGAATPWVEIRFSDMSGGLSKSLESLLQSAQTGNPAGQTQMFAGSKDVHAVGTQVVNGVQAMHYVGTVAPADALSSLSPSVRKGFAPLMKLINGDIRFDTWIDAQHVARRLIEVETVSGHTVTVTLNVTAVNQPVRFALPPADQVTVLPPWALAGR